MAPNWNQFGVELGSNYYAHVCPTTRDRGANVVGLLGSPFEDPLSSSGVSKKHDLAQNGGELSENESDLQDLICSAPEFVQFADLGYPASSPSEVEPVGDLVSASASELLELGYPVSSPSVVEPVGDLTSASELIDLGYPVSSPSVVEPAGDLVSVSASTPFT